MATIAAMVVKIGADIADLKSGMQQVAKSVDGAGVSFGKLTSAHITAEAAMRAVGAVVRAVTGFISGAIEESSKFNNAMIGLSSVAGAFGISANKAKEAAKGLSQDGLMGVGESAAGLKNLLAAGFSLPEATRMMLAFKDAAAFGRQGTLGFGEAIVRATEGIKNGNSTLVDNAGITKNLSVILTEAGFAASDLGKASSNAKIRLAILNGVIKEAAAFSGDAARLSQTYSGAIAKLETQWKFLQATVGDAITQNATVAAAIDLISSLFSAFNTTLTDNGAAFNFVSSVVIGLVKTFSWLLNAIDYIQTGFNALIMVISGVVFAARSLDRIIGEALLGALRKIVSFLPESAAKFLGLTTAIEKLEGFTKNATESADYWGDAMTSAQARSIEWGNAIQGVKGKLDAAIPALEATRGKTVQLGGEQKTLVERTAEAGEKLKGFAKEVDDLDKMLSKAAANGQMPLALEKLESKIKDVAETAKIEGIKIPESINSAFEKIQIAETAKKVAKNLEDALGEAVKATEKNFESLKRVWADTDAAIDASQADSLEKRLRIIKREMDEKRSALDKNGAFFAENLAAIDALERVTAANATRAWQEHVQEVKNAAPSIFNVFKGTLKDIPGLIQAALTGGGGFGGALKATVSKLGSGLGQQLLGGPGGVGQKVAQGATNLLGGKIGGMIGGLMGPIGGMLGSLAGNAVGKLVSVFKKPEHKKVMKDVGKSWGVNISEGLGKEIAEFAKKNNISRELAATLNLSKILDEAGGLTDKNIGNFSKQAMGLFAEINKGGKMAGQAVKELDSFFGELSKRMEANGGIADKNMMAFIAQAQKAKQEIPAVTEFLKAQTQAAVAGLKTFTDNAVVSSQESATAFGATVAALFETLRGGGMSVSEAMAQISPIVAKLSEQFKKAGFDGGEAFAEIEKMAALANDKVAGPMIAGINGLGEAMKGLHNSGLMTDGMFKGLALQVTDTFNGLVSQGHDGDTAMRLIQPTLQTLWQLEKDFGYQVSDSTRELLDKAEAAGVVGDKHRDAADRMATAMERVAQILEAAFGDRVPKAMDSAANAAGRVKQAIDGIPRDIAVNVGYKAYGDLPDGYNADVPQMARGGIVTKPTLLIAGEGGEPEVISPLSQLGRFAGQGGHSGPLNVTINFDRPLMRDAAEREHVTQMVTEALTRKLRQQKRFSVNAS